ncbi:MAG: hypothetical protein U0270_15515 [Labilithrix sp.]
MKSFARELGFPNVEPAERSKRRRTERAHSGIAEVRSEREILERTERARAREGKCHAIGLARMAERRRDIKPPQGRERGGREHSANGTGVARTTAEVEMLEALPRNRAKAFDSDRRQSTFRETEPAKTADPRGREVEPHRESFVRCQHRESRSADLVDDARRGNLLDVFVSELPELEPTNRCAPTRLTKVIEIRSRPDALHEASFEERSSHETIDVLDPDFLVALAEDGLSPEQRRRRLVELSFVPGDLALRRDEFGSLVLALVAEPIRIDEPRTIIVGRGQDQTKKVGILEHASF